MSLWRLALTLTNGPKTIRYESHSMSNERSNNTASSAVAGHQVISHSEKARKSVTVICACIMRDSGQQVLLSMRRAPGVPGLDGKWELPGGKVEFGETPEHAIVREIEEELGLKIVPIRLLPYLHTNIWEYEHAVQHVVLACYECEVGGGISLSTREEDARWFHVNQIDFNLTLPGTREFIGLATHTDWFDKLYIKFECLDSSTHTSKWFAVATQASLFSRYGLMMYWGRMGGRRMSRWQEFTSPRELDEQIFETVKSRLAAGYRISALQGPDRAPEVVARIIELAKRETEYDQISDIA